MMSEFDTRYFIPEPDSVVDEIGFKYSQDMRRLYKAPGRLKKCVIPEGVEKICDEAFFGRSTYEEIELPDSVKFIGERAFSGCHKLKKIRIPDGVSVCASAFSGCRSLPAKYLPLSYRESLGIDIDEDVVADLDCAVDFYDDGSMTSDDGKRLFKAPVAIKEYYIPEGVEVICTGAFCKMSSLKAVVFPHTAKIVGAFAFEGCQRLTIVKLNKELIEVSENAFSRCGIIYIFQLSKSTFIQTNSFGECDNFSDDSLKRFLENLKENMSIPYLVHFLKNNYTISSRKNVLEDLGLINIMEDYQRLQRLHYVKAMETEEAHDFFFKSDKGCVFWVIFLVAIWYVVLHFIL